MNNSTNPITYKKSLFLRISEWFDRLIGVGPEDYLSEEEGKYVDEWFDDLPFWRKRKTNNPQTYSSPKLLIL